MKVIVVFLVWQMSHGPLTLGYFKGPDAMKACEATVAETWYTRCVPVYMDAGHDAVFFNGAD